VQHDIDAPARAPAGARIGHVALDELMALPGLRAHRFADFVEIGAVAGGKVVQPDHFLAAV
jgi:hypothetical protein